MNCVGHNTFDWLVRNINVQTMHNPNDSLTLAAMTRAEIKVIRPALITHATNHIRFAGTLPSISVAFFRVVRSHRATVATCMKNKACQYAVNIYNA